MQECPFDPKESKWLYRDLKRAHELATSAVFMDQNVNIGQPLILFVLEAQNEQGINPSQRDLADELMLSPTTVTMSIKSLERQGCVRKLGDVSDMRKNRIQITEKGRETARICRRALDMIDEGMYLGFSDDEIALISSFFVRMTESLKKLTETTTKAQKEAPIC